MLKEVLKKKKVLKKPGFKQKNEKYKNNVHECGE
jgi:hypothetical protein